MGCCITKRRAPRITDVPPLIPAKVALCECKWREANDAEDMRSTVFLLFGNAATNRSRDAFDCFFDSLFELNITKCNTTCADMWIKAENLTETESETIRTHLVPFTRSFMALEVAGTGYSARHVLSGIAIFRVELLPTFRDAVSDGSDYAPFLDHLLEWEDNLKRILSKRPQERLVHQSLSMLWSGMIPPRIQASHKWWSDDYVNDDCELSNTREEYSLTD